MLRVYNTLTGKEEDFKPLNKGKVKMYVCGITPYDSCHIGHARCYVTFDVIRRYLEFKKYEVTYVQNFTDIDDKIIRRSQELGISAYDLATKYIDEFFEVMDALSIKRASHYPRVTDNMEDIISAVQKLIEKDTAYELDGNVYFKVRSFKDYGKLSKRNIEDLESGARVEINEDKNDPLDFALWKKAKEDEPFWESPWGRGRPGWHIECSVLSTKYLGETLDIHGGGADLIFPHHENEIAETESITNKNYVKYWMHNGFVTVDKEKMSKSLGNISSLKDIFKRYNPLALRLFLLGQHYRSPLEFSFDNLEENTKRLEGFIDLERKIKTYEGKKELLQIQEIDNIEKEFILSMENDFNTAKALSSLHALADYANKHINLSGQVDQYAYTTWQRVKKLGNILGLFEKGVDDSVDESIKAKIDERETARKNKDWKKADEIRDELESQGIVLEDTPRGVRWKKKI
ncbi:MAG: cysteine--tRNA ligase [Elusimicrobiota bacterium]